MVMRLTLKLVAPFIHATAETPNAGTWDFEASALEWEALGAITSEQ